MITIKEVIAWLKLVDTDLDGRIYNSSIDGSKSECVGVYARRHGLVQPTAIGKASAWGIKSLTVLVHWTKNGTTAEAKAIELWQALRAASAHETIGNKKCWIIANKAPVSAGKDDAGIFEYVIDFEIYFRKDS